MVEIFTDLGLVTEGQAVYDIRRKIVDTDLLDGSLIGYYSFGADPLALGAMAVALDPEVTVLIAHRPGVVHPVSAARQLATMNGASGGRVHVNVVTGGAPGDQLREGDTLGHDDRYLRSREYVEVMQKVWSATEPFDHEGRFYSATNVLPLELPPAGIKVFMGGSSAPAVEFGASCADYYMMWGEPVEQVRDRVRSVVERAAELGRPRPRISLSLRLYVDDDESVAWDRARAEPAYQRFLAKGGEVSDRVHAEDDGRNRQLAAARAAEVHDDCLWMGLVAAMHGLGNNAALVGRPDQVIKALAGYRDAGVDAFLVTGPGGTWRTELRDVVARARKELG